MNISIVPIPNTSRALVTGEPKDLIKMLKSTMYFEMPDSEIKREHPELFM